jgi:hypothetical protein
MVQVIGGCWMSGVGATEVTAAPRRPHAARAGVLASSVCTVVSPLPICSVFAHAVARSVLFTELLSLCRILWNRTERVAFVELEVVQDPSTRGCL